MHLRRNQFLIKAPKGAQSIKLSLVDERQDLGIRFLQETKMRVLHLIGSPTSDFHFSTSLMYAR